MEATHVIYSKDVTGQWNHAYLANQRILRILEDTGIRTDSEWGIEQVRYPKISTSGTIRDYQMVGSMTRPERVPLSTAAS